MNGDERSESPAGPVIGRREFIGGATLVAGGIAAAGLVAWPGMAAAQPAVTPVAKLEDWTIDDMWGVWPRYAEPIGYGRGPEERVAAAGSIEELFYA